MKVKILNSKLKESGELDLDQAVFGLPFRNDILARVIDWQLAKRRSGTHKTKMISEVSGTTKKMYKQKGTGSARHGSKRRVQFRGGSVVFGPVVRSHEYDLPKKVRKLGLRIALSAKFQSGDLLIVDKFDLKAPKTKDILAFSQDVGSSKVLVIDGNSCNENALRPCGSLSDFDILPQIGANVYDIMRKDKLVLTVDAVKALEERLK